MEHGACVWGADGRLKCVGASAGMDRQDAVRGWTSKMWMDRRDMDGPARHGWTGETWMDRRDMDGPARHGWTGETWMDRQDMDGPVRHGWTSEMWMDWRDVDGLARCGWTGETWMDWREVDGQRRRHMGDGRRCGTPLDEFRWHERPWMRAGVRDMRAWMYRFLLQGMDVVLQFSSIYP